MSRPLSTNGDESFRLRWDICWTGYVQKIGSRPVACRCPRDSRRTGALYRHIWPGVRIADATRAPAAGCGSASSWLTVSVATDHRRSTHPARDRGLPGAARGAYKPGTDRAAVARCAAICASAPRGAPIASTRSRRDSHDRPWRLGSLPAISHPMKPPVPEALLTGATRPANGVRHGTLLVDLGLRVGEVAALQLDDLNWQDGTVRSARQVAPG